MRLATSVLTAVLGLVFMTATSAAPAGHDAGVKYFPRKDAYPFSSAVQVGHVLYLSGMIGIAEDGKGLAPGGLAGQAHRMFALIGQTLKQHGLGYDNLFKCTVMLADMKDWPAFNKIYASYFQPGHYPARSAMGVAGLALGAKVEMECWAHIPKG